MIHFPLQSRHLLHFFILALNDEDKGYSDDASQSSTILQTIVAPAASLLLTSPDPCRLNTTTALNLSFIDLGSGSCRVRYVSTIRPP